MLVVVGQFPSPANERDGMIQRVAFIDSLLGSRERIYLDISYRRHWRLRKTQNDDLLTVMSANAFLHLPVIFSYLRRANCIYVHSIYNAIKIWWAYPFMRIVTDMHGVVPEELHLESRHWRAMVYTIVERWTVRFSTAIISVTDAMAAHIIIDAPRKIQLHLVLPVLPTGFSEPFTRSKTILGPVRALYSGGLQVWQNTGLMLNAMRQTHMHALFKVLTQDVTAFRNLMNATAGPDSADTISVLSVPKNHIFTHYYWADFGFVLRDDNLINQVACPTKLVEYLATGVIPVVLQPRIGDFDTYGYAYVLLDDFVSGRIPGANAREHMRQRNYDVLSVLRERAAVAQVELLALCDRNQ